jgi:hypothetical protein
LISSVVIITIVVVISIVVLTYFGTISVNIGIVLSALSLVVPNVITAIGYFLKPRVALEIRNLKFVKKSLDHSEGYQLKALVTNNGKKICLKLDATFQIRDTQGRSPNLLHVVFEKTDSHERVVYSSEEDMRNIGHAWMDEKDQTIMGTSTLEELRREDFVGLVFPHEETWVNIIPTSIIHKNPTYSETYLKLQSNTHYEVFVEVKGEDSEKNTISKPKSVKIKPLS